MGLKFSKSRGTLYAMKKYKIVYDLNEPDPPRPHELHAARIVAEYFHSDLVFIRKSNNSTPDLKVKKTKQVWELKSPLGNGKRTMANNIRAASHQSTNIILDLSRCKMNNDRAISRIRSFLEGSDAHISKLLVIDKKGNTLDFSNKNR